MESVPHSRTQLAFNMLVERYKKPRFYSRIAIILLVTATKCFENTTNLFSSEAPKAEVSNLYETWKYDL